MKTQRLEELGNNLAHVKHNIEERCQTDGRDASRVKLIVVTKNFPASDVELLYQLGQRDFGENKEQELTEKARALQHLPDIRWHFIGQIQSRKVAKIAQVASYIHSVDRLKILRKLEAYGAETPQKIFVQINLEPERIDRGGAAAQELAELIKAASESVHIQFLGLMCVLPADVNPCAVLKNLSEQQKFFEEKGFKFPELSVGMSNDYLEAIDFSATYLRIGSKILGNRIT
ncbi:MAG: YggS family pyridoxal phosphate-dependent enzyme [Micrococcaceae bacterium]